MITFRVKLMQVDALDDATRYELFKHLLHLNANEMVAGAYGLEDDAVVIIDSLQSENLDFNEFQASIDSITLSIREHYQQIRTFIPATEFAEEETISEQELEAQIMAES